MPKNCFMYCFVAAILLRRYHGKFLLRVHESRPEIAIYMEEEHRPEVELFRDQFFMMILGRHIL